MITRSRAAVLTAAALALTLGACANPEQAPSTPASAGPAASAASTPGGRRCHKSMLAQGAQLLIVAPLNSDGLAPALDAAKEKKVPVVTIDRKVTSQPCTDYLTFIGSDFVSQGKRAADAMIQATGGTGKVAILLGSSGNNVTTDRTQGFKDGIAGARACRSSPSRPVSSSGPRARP